MKLKHFKILYENFGFGIAFPAFFASRFKSAALLKRERILTYLKTRYSSIISTHNYTTNTQEHITDSYAIWTLWWQGKDEVPEVVKACFDSMNNNRGKHSLIILDKNNFRDYIDFPEHVMKKFSMNAISITHLSELIREYLLSRYGGLWLDSTVFVAKEIPEEIFQMKYFTIKRPINTHSRFISQGLWTSAVQASEKGNIMSNFIYDFLIEYLKNENCFIDYFLIDYVIKIALEELPECQKIFDEIPINNPNVMALHELLNSKWDEERYEQLKKDTYLFKLAWRTNYKNLDRIRKK